MSRLKELYIKIIPELKEELGIKETMALPKVVKVVLNVGIGQAKTNPKFADAASETLQIITGQKPVEKQAKKAISGFKIREGDKVGLTVTLRGEKMYDFLDKFANIALPRMRDFRGLSPKSFDQDGNFSFGVKEQIIFPEITHEKTEISHGLQINITIKNSNKEKSEVLLKKLGFPFKTLEKTSQNAVSSRGKEQNG